MRRFRFPMQKLLDLKSYREGEWEIKLGEITGRMEELRRRIEGCADRRRRGFELRAGSGSDRFALVAADNYVRRMEQEQGRLRERLTSLALEREEIQACYLKASRERKVFDKLREKQEGEYYKEARKSETREADDLNGSASARGIEQRLRGVEP